MRDRFAQNAIRKAPQNQSPWNYLRGIVNNSGMPLSDIKAFALEFASVDQADKVSSSHALDLLAETYAKEGQTQNAAKAYDLLSSKYDPIRANYWEYLKGQMSGDAIAA